jgi:hypothetical protein
VLAEPDPQTFPTVRIAEPVGWGEGEAPEAAEGLVVNRFAEGSSIRARSTPCPMAICSSPHPRAEAEGGSPAGWLTKGWSPASCSARPARRRIANQIVLLRDADGDGTAENGTVLRRRARFAGRHGWKDGNALRRQPRCGAALRLCAGRDKVYGRARAS